MSKPTHAALSAASLINGHLHRDPMKQPCECLKCIVTAQTIDTATGLPQVIAGLKEIRTIADESPGACRKRMGTRRGNTIVEVDKLLALLNTPKAKAIHPCDCKGYNGGQCYNCLNGAHNLCDATPKCKTPRAQSPGLTIVST